MSSVRALAPRKTLAERVGIEPEKLELLRDQIAPGAPDSVLELYFERCRLTGADPFARMFYAQRRNVKEGNEWKTRWTIETTIDGLRSIAESTGEYDGQSEPTFGYDEHGRLRSCAITVYRRGMSRGVTAVAFFSEFAQVNRDGSLGPLWEKMPHNQLAKCCEALALRKAFPRQLSGLYTGDEMAQSENAEPRHLKRLPEPQKAQDTTDAAPGSGESVPVQQEPILAQSEPDPIEDAAYNAIKPIWDDLPSDLRREIIYDLTGGRTDDFTQIQAGEARAAYVVLRNAQKRLEEGREP